MDDKDLNMPDEFRDNYADFLRECEEGDVATLILLGLFYLWEENGRSFEGLKKE